MSSEQIIDRLERELGDNWYDSTDIYERAQGGYSMKTKITKQDILVIIAIISFAIFVNIIADTGWYQALMVALSQGILYRYGYCRNIVI